MAAAFVRGQVVAGRRPGRAHLVDVAGEVTVRALCGKRYLVRDLQAAACPVSCQRCEDRQARRRISVIGGGVQ